MSDQDELNAEAELDASMRIQELEQLLERARLNTRWILEQIDKTLNIINPDFIGTWQQNVEYVCKQARMVNCNGEKIERQP